MPRQIFVHAERERESRVQNSVIVIESFEPYRCLFPCLWSQWMRFLRRCRHCIVDWWASFSHIEVTRRPWRRSSPPPPPPHSHPRVRFGSTALGLARLWVTTATELSTVLGFKIIITRLKYIWRRCAMCVLSKNAVCAQRGGKHARNCRKAAEKESRKRICFFFSCVRYPFIEKHTNMYVDILMMYLHDTYLNIYTIHFFRSRGSVIFIKLI